MPNKQRPSTRKAFFFGFDGFRRLSFDQPVRNRRLFVSQRGPCSSVNSQTDKSPPSGLVDNSLLRKTPSSKAKIAKRNAVSRPVPHAKHAHVRVENDQAGSITFICRRVSSGIVFFLWFCLSFVFSQSIMLQFLCSQRSHSCTRLFPDDSTSSSGQAGPRC